MAQNKILIIGAAEFSDALMLLKSWKRVYGLEKTQELAKRLVITELRDYTTLQQDYPDLLDSQLEELQGYGVVTAGPDSQIKYGINALDERPQENRFPGERTLAAEDLHDVGFVMWASPYFAPAPQAAFPAILRSFFKKMSSLSEQAGNPVPPKIGIALDCLSSDSLNNLNTRFDVGNVPGWNIDHIVKLRGHYYFSPTHTRHTVGHEAGRTAMPEVHSPFVQMLLYEPNDAAPAQPPPEALPQPPETENLSQGSEQLEEKLGRHARPSPESIWYFARRRHLRKLAIARAMEVAGETAPQHQEQLKLASRRISTLNLSTSGLPLATEFCTTFYDNKKHGLGCDCRGVKFFRKARGSDSDLPLSPEELTLTIRQERCLAAIKSLLLPELVEEKLDALGMSEVGNIEALRAQLAQMEAQQLTLDMLERIEGLLRLYSEDDVIALDLQWQRFHNETGEELPLTDTETPYFSHTQKPYASLYDTPVGRLDDFMTQLAFATPEQEQLFHRSGLCFRYDALDSFGNAFSKEVNPFLLDRYERTLQRKSDWANRQKALLEQEQMELVTQKSDQLSEQLHEETRNLPTPNSKLANAIYAAFRRVPEAEERTDSFTEALTRCLATPRAVIELACLLLTNPYSDEELIELVNAHLVTTENVHAIRKKIIRKLHYSSAEQAENERVVSEDGGKIHIDLSLLEPLHEMSAGYNFDIRMLIKSHSVEAQTKAYHDQLVRAEYRRKIVRSRKVPNSEIMLSGLPEFDAEKLLSPKVVKQLKSIETILYEKRPQLKEQLRDLDIQLKHSQETLTSAELKSEPMDALLVSQQQLQQQRQKVIRKLSYNQLKRHERRAILAYIEKGSAPTVSDLVATYTAKSNDVDALAQLAAKSTIYDNVIELDDAIKEKCAKVGRELTREQLQHLRQYLIKKYLLKQYRTELLDTIMGFSTTFLFEYADLTDDQDLKDYLELTPDRKYLTPHSRLEVIREAFYNHQDELIAAMTVCQEELRQLGSNDGEHDKKRRLLRERLWQQTQPLTHLRACERGAYSLASYRERLGHTNLLRRMVATGEQGTPGRSINRERSKRRLGQTPAKTGQSRVGPPSEPRRSNSSVRNALNFDEVGNPQTTRTIVPPQTPPTAAAEAEPPPPSSLDVHPSCLSFSSATPLRAAAPTTATPGGDAAIGSMTPGPHVTFCTPPHTPRDRVDAAMFEFTLPPSAGAEPAPGYRNGELIERLCGLVTRQRQEAGAGSSTPALA